MNSWLFSWKKDEELSAFLVELKDNGYIVTALRSHRGLWRVAAFHPIDSLSSSTLHVSGPSSRRARAVLEPALEPKGFLSYLIEQVVIAASPLLLLFRGQACRGSSRSRSVS